MADRISWIKNLLSLATPTEREALSQVRTHAADPGTERLIIGDRHGPADLSQTLQNIGDNKQVMWPDGFRELKQKIAGEGSEMFQAHAHPSGDPTPSLADLETWANDHYVSALNKQGTYLPASKYARDRMWIASPLSNQNTLMMDPMPYKDFHATAGTLQQIRDADATYKMKLFDKNNPDRAEYFQRLQDFTAPWLKPETTSNEELARTYTSLGRAHKTNQQAAAVPITMDPAGYLTKYRPDLQVGDVYPEWFKYLEQKGDPIFKAEGGQIPGFAGGNQFNPANFLGAVRSYFRAMEDVKSRPITIGASDEVLPQIIKDQRFKSQFETGDSKGMYNPERRARYENEAFGYPFDLDSAQRPIYGHVTDRFRPDMAAHYGTWGAVLKPEVKDRSSFFLGDSLFQDQPSYGPYWWNRGENIDRRVMGEPASQEDRFKDYVREIIGNKQRSNASLVPVDPPVASRFPSTSGVYMPGNYIEAQVHGGLPWSDVKALVRKGRSGMPAREGDIFDINQAADLGGVPAYRWRPHSDVPGGKEWFKAEPGVSGTSMIDPDMLKEFGYAEGGQHDEPMPPFPLAYASQYFDDGGQMKGPVLASTGPQIMRKGLDAALRHAMEYFGGLKSPTLPYKISDQPRIHPEIPHWANRFADTTWQPSASAAGSTDARWLESMRAAGIDVSKPLDVGHPVRSAIESYTGSEYDNMNGILRRFAGNPEKTSPDLGNNPGLDWWRRGELDPNLVRHAADYMPHVPKELNELSKYLQDQEFELPYDIYRGSRMRGFEGIENLLPEHGMPQVRGTGIGSFSYTPSTSYAFGQDQLKTPQPLHNLAEDWQKAENQMKVPSVVRIPQGTKVRGMNVAQYSGLPTESEVLMAPFQGFDVTGTNLISPAPYVHGSSPRLLLNAEPSGIYDPHSPIIYGKGGAVSGYAGGGLENIVNYIRGISKPIKGYHVSPHDFDQFSSAHIGTGEGNKNFGHGLYFMESPSLRDRYLKDLGEQFSGQPIRQYDVDIHGDPRQFLSLDEPLNTQGTIGKRAADYLQAPKDWTLRPPDRTFPRMEDQVTDPAFSKFMSDEGAAGTRYFDSRSKQQGFGTQNYVTFPTMDDIIEITGKKARGGQIPGYAEGGYDDDPSQRYSIPPGSFGLPTPPTPTFQVPIGKGQATVGSNYDMINKIIEAQLGYEHPVGSHGARLGVSGNFNKYIGEGGDQVKPNWGVGLRLNLPFAEGGAVPGYQMGSKVADTIRQTLRSFRDAPADKLIDWPWHPLSKVAKDLPTEIPQHVLDYGDFMRDQAKKISTEGLDTRDSLKSYLTTLASMQRQAISRDALPDLKLTSDERLIRPEGAYADWLGSKWGQKYLEYAKQGEAHPEAVADAVQNMTPYGMQNLLGRQMMAAPQIVPGTEAALADQVNRASRGIRSPSQWAAATDPYEGIDAAKKGFFGSMIGYGDRPTLDARQLNLHAVDPDMAKNVMRRVDGGEQAVQRLADRQRALDFQMPWEYDPYYQHLAHHTIWDATSGTVTPHTDLIDMMKNRAEGGQYDPYDDIIEAQRLMGAYK